MTIAWSDFPLDYELSEYGNYYHDPTVPDTSLTWMYAVLPKGYDLPAGLTYEILYSVFIPDNYPEYEKYETVLDELEYRAFSITGNEEEENAKAKRTKWHPSATIRVWDDLKGQYIPLDGVRVRVTQTKGCKTDYTVTDANGYCHFDHNFKGQVQYSIEWKRAYWKIQDGQGNMAEKCGPKKTNATWNYDIGSIESNTLMYATIHRAAIVAFYKNIWTIKRPTKGNLLHRMLSVRAYGNGNGGKAGQAKCMHGDMTADIYLWKLNSTQQRYTTVDLFATTIHELSHQSHMKYAGSNDFEVTNVFIKESWATCVAWYITTCCYPNELSGQVYPHGYDNGTQSWTNNLSDLLPYTPVFIDLMDDYNQGGTSSSYVVDNISGYTLQEIQNNILEDSHNLTTLEATLKAHKLHGETDAQIEQLLYKYDNLSF